jgi:hypothetical protein
MVRNFQIDGSNIPAVLGPKETKSDVIFTRGKYLPIITVSLYGKAE